MCLFLFVLSTTDARGDRDFSRRLRWSHWGNRRPLRKDRELQIRSIISKIIYAVLLSSLQPSPEPPVPRKLFRRSDHSRYNRAVSIVHMLDRVIPGVSRRLSRSIYGNSRFPWSPVSTELIARGSGAAIFKLNWSHGPKVVRIYRRSLGRSLAGLLKVAGYYQSRYRMLSYWYGGPLGLIPEMEFLVLQGPYLVGPVAASLQPYIHGQKRDLFQDFTDDELLLLLKEKPFIREQFLFFAKQTLCQWEEGKMCLDFLGRQNVMVVNQGGKHRLVLPDLGIFEFEALAKKHPKKISQLEKRVHRLARLYEGAREL